MLRASLLRCAFGFAGLVTLSSCHKGSSANVSSTLAYDGVICAQTITSNLTAAAFVALLQNGTSAANPYIVCIADGVGINSGSTSQITLNFQNLVIQGYSNTTSSLTNVALSPDSGTQSVTFSRLKMIGNSAPALNSNSNGDNVCTLAIQNANISSNQQGINFFANGTLNSTVAISNSVMTTTSDGVTMFSNRPGTANVSLTGSTLTSSANGLSFDDGGSGTYTTNLTNSTITATGEGLSLNAGGNNTSTLTLTGLTITTGGSAVIINSGGTVAVQANLGDLNLRASSSSSGTKTALIFNGGSGGSVVLNSSSSTKSLVCNVSGSLSTFTNILSVNLGSMNTSFTGSFSEALNTENGTDTNIATCP